MFDSLSSKNIIGDYKKSYCVVRTKRVLYYSYVSKNVLLSVYKKKASVFH